MATFELRQIFMPYCLQKTADGGYVVLNRKYKPLGTVTNDWVDYDAHPSKFKFKRKLSDKQVAALSWKGDSNADCIYLYNDGCVPTDGQASWTAYSARLQRIAAYDISTD